MLTASATIPLLLFAKAPIAGKVKTRLQSHCTQNQAADIAKLLLEASLQQACDYWPGDVYVSTWLDFEHPVLLALCARFNVKMLRQCDGDLGAKMNHAFETHGYPLAIMGCDAPHVTSNTLKELYARLEQGQSAIGPSLDGGYYIIGLSEPSAYLFNAMPWGSDQVLELTRARLAGEQANFVELAALQDIDEWQDLLSARSQLPTLDAYLQQQGLI